MMNNVLRHSLALRLQENLDAVVQSPSTFSKLNASDGISHSIVADSGDEASAENHPVAATSRTGGSINTVDNSDDESSINKSSVKGYTDFSRVPTAKIGTLSSLLDQPITSAKEPTFPVKLHLILSNPEFDDIIAWLPHGRSWRILQHKALEERVIPLYFRHGRYASFARQVNGWGFRRVTHGSDYNSYYHEMFLRGMPHLCVKMRRLTSKDASSRKKGEEEPAPDFYVLSSTNPLPETPVIPDPQNSAVNLIADGSHFDMESAAFLGHRRRTGLVDRVSLLTSASGGLRSEQQLLAGIGQGGFQGVGFQNGLQGLQNLQNVSSEAAMLYMLPGHSSSFGGMNSHQEMAQHQQQQQQHMQLNFPSSSDMAPLLLMSSMRAPPGSPGVRQMNSLVGSSSLNLHGSSLPFIWPSFTAYMG